jgi:outer membrane immunogenic protein
MRRLSIALIAALSTVAFTQIASAADMPVKAPVYKAPVVAPYNWTGFYFGANGGYAWRNRSASFTPADPAAAALFGVGIGTPLPNSNFDIKGGFGGIQLGYNWQFYSKWVVGLETDLDFGNIKGSGTSSNILPLPQNLFDTGTATVSEHIKWFGTVRARLGYLVTSEFLLYGTGGFAYGRVEQDANYVMTGSSGFSPSPFSFQCTPGIPCFAGSSSRVQTGWTAGGGAEWAFSNNLTFKVEYLYVNLGSHSFPMTATALQTAGFTPSSVVAGVSDADFHSVRVGINYRFN